MQEMEKLSAKLAETLNKVIDTAMSPAAQELMTSFFTYVRVIAGFRITLFVGLAILLLFGWRRAIAAVKKDSDMIPAVLVMTFLTALYLIPAMTEGPKVVATLYDPRLYLVFKVLD